MKALPTICLTAVFLVAIALAGITGPAMAGDECAAWAAARGIPVTEACRCGQPAGSGTTLAEWQKQQAKKKAAANSSGTRGEMAIESKTPPRGSGFEAGKYRIYRYQDTDRATAGSPDEQGGAGFRIGF